MTMNQRLRALSRAWKEAELRLNFTEASKSLREIGTILREMRTRTSNVVKAAKSWRHRPVTLTTGTVLTHTYRGKPVATCTYIGEGIFRYGERIYESPTEAALAASKDLGLKSKVLNGWRFWNIEQTQKGESHVEENSCSEEAGHYEGVGSERVEACDRQEVPRLEGLRLGALGSDQEGGEEGRQAHACG